MKKIMVITSHSDYENSKVNKRLIEELKKHPEITLNNLNEKYPNYKIDAKAEQDLLLSHDRVVFQYPLHWYNVPDLLRTWQDSVLTPTFSKESKELFAGKEGMLAITTGGPAEYYQGNYSDKDKNIEMITKPMELTIGYIGMKYLSGFNIYGAPSLSEEELNAKAKEYVEFIIK